MTASPVSEVKIPVFSMESGDFTDTVYLGNMQHLAQVICPLVLPAVH